MSQHNVLSHMIEMQESKQIDRDTWKMLKLLKFNFAMDQKYTTKHLTKQYYKIFCELFNYMVILGREM